MYINTTCLYKNKLPFTINPGKTFICICSGSYCRANHVRVWLCRLMKHPSHFQTHNLSGSPPSARRTCKAYMQTGKQFFWTLYLAKVQASRNFTQRFSIPFCSRTYNILVYRYEIKWSYTLSSQLNMRMTWDKKLDSFMQSCFIK